MLPRFLATTLTRNGPTAELGGDEAHHLSKVMRLREGDAVLVFDGAGLQRQALVDAIHRGRVTLRLGDIVPAAPELKTYVTLAQALLKGDAMDHVVRDATTIGVREIAPLVTSRVETRVPAERAAARIDRWRRVAGSAAKQCGRAVVPRVSEPRLLADVLAEPDEVMCVVLVEPSADVRLTSIDDLPRAAGRVVVLAGPEGGWTSEELELARERAALVSLGGRTLRAETIAIAALPVVLHRLGAWP